MLESRFLWLAGLSFALFLMLVSEEVPTVVSGSNAYAGRVVLNAPLLVALHGGDRFLAANLETIRLSATGLDEGVADDSYLMRAQLGVAELNACQEQNYYLANALLNWVGAIDQGDKILEMATACRFWDELPPFFLGFNRYFFRRDTSGAAFFLEVAARRASKNSSGFKKLAIMVRSEQFKDERLALDFLRQERSRSKDPKLSAMLDKRVKRLEGLIQLREAQERYESFFHKRLASTEALLDSGVLNEIPSDPLGLGYEFVGGRFMLKKINVAGIDGK